MITFGRLLITFYMLTSVYDLNRLPEGFRNRRFHSYFLACRKLKGDVLRMQHQARKMSLYGFVAIEQIPDNGMADAVEMHANLMASTGSGVSLDQGILFQPLRDVKMSATVLASLQVYAHPSRAELPHRLVDGTLIQL